MYEVQGWIPAQDAWVSVEECRSPVKAFDAFGRFMLMYGSGTEYRLVTVMSAGQPQVICANSPRGFEVGK